MYITKNWATNTFALYGLLEEDFIIIISLLFALQLLRDLYKFSTSIQTAFMCWEALFPTVSERTIKATLVPNWIQFMWVSLQFKTFLILPVVC